MKLKYQQAKGNRIKYGFRGFTTYEKNWWYNKTLKKWEHNLVFKQYDYSSHQPCKSIKAFRRLLKKCPSNVLFYLESKWRSHDVLGSNS